MSVLPDEIVERLLDIGRVEWGATEAYSDEKHIANFTSTLRKTREHFGINGDVQMHGVYIEGSEVVVAHTGTSPNSPAHARIMVEAWNGLVDIAKAQKAKRRAVRHG